MPPVLVLTFEQPTRCVQQADGLYQRCECPTGKEITDAQADALIALAMRILAVL